MFFIVINPNADRKQSILRLPMLTKLFDKARIEYDVHITTAPMEAQEKTRKFCTRYADCQGIIGIGGDGTFQEITAGMADAFAAAQNGGKIPIPLGILPSGRANDFLSTLWGKKYIPKDPKTTVHNFFDTLMKKRLRTIDLMTANGMAFLNIGHVGLDARIAENADALKYKYDEYSYRVAGFKSIFKYSGIPLTMDIEGEKHTGNYTLAAVCNAQYYGGGMRIAPPAKIDDGKITLCLVKNMSLPRTMLALVNVLREKHERIKDMSFRSCGGITITVPPTILCLDGNCYRREGDIEFKILPGALEVFV